MSARRHVRARASLTEHVLAAALAASGCTRHKLELSSDLPSGTLLRTRSAYGWSLGAIERMARGAGLRPSELLARAEALAEQEGGQ
jgi:hypothetical protein